MQFSILHFSDLHRDPADELESNVLLESIRRDVGRFAENEPSIQTPALAIVSGDLVFGVKPEHPDPDTELRRQYDQAEEFLIGIAGHFFAGNRQRVILLPGNHDISLPHVMSSVVEVPIPAELAAKRNLVKQLFTPHSNLRWSWPDLTLYSINNVDRYQRRMEPFAEMYSRFYAGAREFHLDPEGQLGLFDFPEIGFTCVTLNSCFENDPLRRAASVHPSCVSGVSERIREPAFAGRLIAAAWHHNLAGGPLQDDYLDAGLLQVLIDAGISLGFHGHQHRSQLIEERFQLDERRRHLTIFSAGSLGSGPAGLPPGDTRSYNVVELDTETLVGRLHQRRMSNVDFAQPVWTAGHFPISQKSYIEFPICPPLTVRPAGLDIALRLDRAEKLLRAGGGREAVETLQPIQNHPFAQPLLLEALSKVEDDRLTIRTLSFPSTIGEAVVLGHALVKSGSREEIARYLESDLVRAGGDASIRDVVERLERKVL